MEIAAKMMQINVADTVGGLDVCQDTVATGQRADFFRRQREPARPAPEERRTLYQLAVRNGHPGGTPGAPLGQYR